MDTAFAKDDILFAEESEGEVAPSPSAAGAWKVLVVDDDEEVHHVTRLVLDGFTFADKGLEFINALTGSEAQRLIAENPDTAVMLLDVVMESDHAGLDVAKYVREELGNSFVRIVLRTGQPGQAPEHRVITDYDINDYKEKTELTAQKLYTLMYASLRSYRDIMTIEASKKGLEKVIDASANIFELRSLGQFTEGVLEQLTSLLHLDQDAAYLQIDGLAAACDDEAITVLAGTGAFQDMVGADARETLSADCLSDLLRAADSESNLYSGERFVGIFKGKQDEENLVYMQGIQDMSDLDKSLVEVFAKNVSIAFENVHLNRDIEDTQREIVYMLGEAVETRSRETGNHVKRVAEISKLLALASGLDAEEAKIVKMASPMHDIGKIGIPDSILNKPGKLTPEEWGVMKGHARLGHDMLKSSKRRILRASSVIALDHHEQWNGSGYPNEKRGEDIHLYGRITAVADVFDALGSDRCYKKAWPTVKVIEFMREQRGKHFDPALIDILIANLDQVFAIGEKYAGRHAA